MCDTMDWDLISEQVVSHVEECLPRDSPPPTSVSDEVSPAEVGPLAAEDSSLRSFEHRSSLKTSGRAISFVEEQHRGQAAKNGDMRAKRNEVGRNVNEVLQVMHRIELVEERVSDQDNDFAHFRIVSSRAEGVMAALQRRQAQLDTDVCGLRDILETTDRRCLKAESSLHEVVGQAQVIDAIRSIIDPLRDQVQARLSKLENDASDLRNLLGHGSTRELSSELEARMSAALSAEIQRSQARHTQMKEWIEITTDRERKRHESEEATLREEVNQLSREVKSGQRLSHQAETKAKELESTVRSFEKRLTLREAELVTRMRKEVEESEAGLRRRMQEVRVADLRRIDDICTDLVRDKHSRLQERVEVAREISDVRDSLQRTEQHWQGRSHELLNRLEVTMANTANDHSRTRCSINSISSQLKQLQVEVQGVNERFTNERAQRVFKERCQDPEDCAVGGHQVLLTQSRLSLPHASFSETSRITPKAASESSDSARTTTAGLEEMKKVLPPGSGGQEVKQIETRGRASQASAQTAPSCEDPPPPVACPASARKDHALPTPTTDKQKDTDHRCRPGEGDDKPDAREETVQSPSEGGSERSSSVGHSGDFVPGVTVEDKDRVPTLGDVDATRASPPRDSDEDGLRVARANDLRKSALAAASLSVDEEEREPSSNDAAKMDACRLRNESPARSFCSSSPSRSLASDPLPPRQLFPENGDLLPGVTVASGTPPGALVVNSTEMEESRSMSESGADGFCADASGGIGPGVGERRGGSRPPLVTHRTERDSDSTSSSFSEDEGAASEASTRPGPGPMSVSEQKHAHGDLWQQKNESSPFVSPKPISLVSTPSKPKDNAGDEGAEDAPRTNRREGAPPPPPPRLDRAGGRNKSATTGCTAGPAPISLRARSASRESGVVTAQCEFCLRRYLKAAMDTHLQACELRLERCPYQCGAKVLVRNLEGHKKSCSMRLSADLQEGVDSPDTSEPTASTSTTSREPPPDETTGKKNKTAEDERSSRTGKREALAIGPGDAGRTVTCMRCHESLPFMLVPSHGPNCKGSKVDNGEGAPGTSPEAPAAANERPPPPPSELRGPPSKAAENRSSFSLSSPISAQAPRVTMARPSLLATGGMIPPSLSSSPGGVGSPAKGFPVRSEFSPRSLSASSSPWQADSRIGTVLPPGVRVPPSPPRPKNVRSWGTRQVTSWLREVMRPPRADVISRFHERGVVGTTLLSMTNRYLMQSNNGMGITDEDVRAQILEAIVSLKD